MTMNEHNARDPRPAAACLVRPTLHLAHLFATVQPSTDDACRTWYCRPSMQLFLERSAVRLAPDEHAVMVMDHAGWHITDDLAAAPNISLILPPFYSPALNPVERVWLCLRKRSLNHRLLNSYGAIVEALCIAWNKLTQALLTSLTPYPYLNQVRFLGRLV